MAADLLRRAGRLVHRKSAPLRYRAALLATALRGRRAVRLLLLSDGAVYTSEQQLAPFARHAGALRRTLGLVARFMGVAQGERLSPAALRRYDVIGLKCSFMADKAAVLGVARKLREGIDGSATRLVYFDGDDDLNVLWPELIALCDGYVKKHAYRDRADYGVARIGKTNLTDHVARTTGLSFADNPFPATPPLERALADKVAVGWNIGLDDKIAALARRMPRPGAAPRPVDVCSRAYTAPESWIYALRNPVATALEAMASDMTVLVPRNRVGQQEYYDEMLSSTICVSPFGYGEICWRDFEAILCGCLLVKPDMAHVETAPDIFVPGVTYVPVRWDYADLPEICARYLAQADERRRIVERAYDAVIASQSAEWFVQRVRALRLA